MNYAPRSSGSGSDRTRSIPPAAPNGRPPGHPAAPWGNVPGSRPPAGAPPAPPRPGTAPAGAPPPPLGRPAPERSAAPPWRSRLHPGREPRHPVLSTRTAAHATGTQIFTLRPAGRFAALATHGAWPLTAVLFVLALAVRAFGLIRANDLFIDELIYAELGRTVAQGSMPSLGEPFFLHPAGSFVVNGLVIRAFGLVDLPAMDLVFALRWTTAVLGALLVAFVFRMLYRLVPLMAALGAALVVMLDSFVLRTDSRVMIETFAMAPTIGGWLLLTWLLSRPTRPGDRWREVGAGVVMGLGLVTKDMTAIQVLLPLVLAMFWRRTLPWARALRVLGGTVIPYTIYMIVVTGNGLLPAWLAEKASGVRRMIGLDQETGFHAAKASLSTRIVEELSRFGTSYVLLGACLFAGVFVLFSASAARRMLGMIGAFTGLFAVYTLVAGALEEQFGYYVVIVSIIVSTVALVELRDRRPALGRWITIGAIVFVGLTAVLGVSARFAVDDGFRQADTWMSENLPADARVGLTGPTAEFAFLPHEGWDVWPSLTSLRDNDATFVLTASQPLSQGYGYAAPDLLTWLQQNATPVFTTHGPSNGDTVVWRLDRDKLDGAVAAGVRLPPINGGHP